MTIMSAVRILLISAILLHLPAFASLPKSVATECESATQNGPIKKTRIDGGEDSTFIAAIIAMLDDFWREQTKKLNPEDLGITPATLRAVLGQRFAGVKLDPSQKYQDLKVVLYRGSVHTSAGRLTDDLPSYSSFDKTLFISHRALQSRLLGYIKVDSAWAYVLAHEMGHHIQNQMGYFELVGRLKPDSHKAHALTTRMELQADCLAGFWMGRNTNLFGSSEIEKIAKMPSTIGSPDHGTGAERDFWFHVGFYATSIRDCGEVFLRE